VYKIYEDRLSRLINAGQSECLRNGLIGLEKETLRVGADGKIAQTPHPVKLGSPLTHPYITTDYSEALTELITPPFSDPVSALDFLKQTQTYVYQNIEDELLWATSMPCVVAGETSIPIAQYGSSNAGLMKTAYRRGLGHRYGRVMQVIAGVHFNYSIPEKFWPVYQELEKNSLPLQAFINQSYFQLIRNLLRFGWLIPYLFGASPAICKSFLAGKETNLDEFNDTTFYEPFATSLRMGDIGYQNNKEKLTGMKANYDSVESYINSLAYAINTPYPEYKEFGVEVGGVYQQLNANILQIENEYYSTVRPKQILQGNEMPIRALSERGIKYIELRSLDVNAFDPLGVNLEQIRFLEAFMLFCLFHDGSVLESGEREEIDRNELVVAHEGRRDDCTLLKNGKEAKLQDEAGSLLQAMHGVCSILDTEENGNAYSHSCTRQLELVLNPEATPSARMLAAMRESGDGFFNVGMAMSKQHQSYFKNIQLDSSAIKNYDEIGQHSLLRQKELEDTDSIDFSSYLQEYFRQSEGL